MDKDFFTQADTWTFPEFEVAFANDLDDETSNQETYSQQEMVEMQIKQEITLHKQENFLLKEEIEALKANAQMQMDMINKLFIKLKTPISIIDEEIVELMQDIIKKLTKRIICKEMEAEPSIIVQMIEELRSIMETKNGLVAIHLAANDHRLLDSLQSNFSNIACIDTTLNDGDIVLKSNFGEVRGLLNDRIEQLMRVEHD